MVFRIQQVSNYGTSTPAVARTFYQGCEILGFFQVAAQKQEEAKGVLHELQRHLVRCVEIQDLIVRDIEAAHEEIKVKGFAFQSGGRVVTLPSVPDLQSRAESFLQSAKLAIRETALLVKPFYGVTHDHRYQRFAAWAKQQFGPDDKFTLAVKDWEPWVKTIVAMRNVVDHPADTSGGKLVTENLNLGGTREAPELVDPTWGLSGDPQRPLVAEMSAVVEGIIELGEEILAALFSKLQTGAAPLVLYEIPVEQRDPKCPIRLRVAFAPGFGGAT